MERPLEFCPLSFCSRPPDLERLGVGCPSLELSGPRPPGLVALGDPSLSPTVFLAAFA